MTEHIAFSASGEDVISRTIEIPDDGLPGDTSKETFSEYYDVQRTAEEIMKGDYKRIALQFPDELLHDSVPIYRALKSSIGPGKDLYVLADTSYGSCCVDEVAAQHVDADAVVHYGHACMSQTSRLPVIYVFGKKAIDTRDCIDCLVKTVTNTSSKKQIMLKFDVAYAHKADAILDGLRLAFPSIHFLHAPISARAEPVQSESAPQRLTTNESSPTVHDLENPPSEDATGCSTIFYIGGESLTLTNLLMTHASYEVHSYDPVAKMTRLESARTNKLLMRRYAVVQKARDVDVIGILVGTLGVASYLPLISHLRSLISRSHKKSYTISVGKLNPAKLANFLEIECFVLVACPENSVIEAKEFLQPIVTPYELELALQQTLDWTGQYVLDFSEVLETAAAVNDPREAEEDLDQPVFSLVTGKYRQAKRYGDQTSTSSTANDKGSSAVVLRNQDNAVSSLADSAAGQFLQTRTFKGLETRTGQDAPSVLEQGRCGIARGYEDDHR